MLCGETRRSILGSNWLPRRLVVAIPGLLTDIIPTVYSGMGDAALHTHSQFWN